MKKKKIIRIDAPGEQISLIGISSHEKGYTLTWALNNHLNWSLGRINDLEVVRKGLDASLRFPVFRYSDDTKKLVYYLIQNRVAEGFLLPDYSTTDFILVIPGVISDHTRDELLRNLKEIPGIQTAFIIASSSISNPERLIPE